jgi:hypothetical protein
MGWPNNPRPAKALTQLRKQLNEMFPNRDHESDGLLGDARHRSRSSDHNAWIVAPDGTRVVSAMDVDENLTDQKGNAFSVVHALQRSRDPRIKYLIYERQITVKGDITKWKPYHGPSPHDHHFHISVSSDPRLFDDVRPWSIGSSADVAPMDGSSNPLPGDATTNTPGQNHPGPGRSTEAQTPAILKKGDKGPTVAALQKRLNQVGYVLTVDGDFGPATEEVIRIFQAWKGLDVDGKVGIKTREALGI